MRRPQPPRTSGVHVGRRVPPGTNRDTRYFGRPGGYLKRNGGPGRGPYAWKVSSHPDAEHYQEGQLGGTEPEGWHRCTSDSHLEAVRMLYPLDETEPYVLQVLFKAGGGYEYYGSPGARNHRLETIYHLMEEANSPGELIWSHLITEKFDYAEGVQMLN